MKPSNELNKTLWLIRMRINNAFAFAAERDDEESMNRCRNRYDRIMAWKRNHAKVY